MDELVVELFKINAIKFGDFVTKVGLNTPVYFDLRVIVSYPNLMERLSEIIIEKVDFSDVKLVCGVPYTALPIATIVSCKSKVPMVMRRKEAKSYGTKKLIEGVFTDGDSCLIIEDVVTSGSSILETTKDLRSSGLICKKAIVLLNREQGGEDFLKENGIKMQSLLSMTDLIQILFEKNLITTKTKERVTHYISSNRVKSEALTLSLKEDRLSLSFTKRATYAKNNMAKKLFNVMAKKETNLCVAADLTEATDILNLAEQVGPYICCLKTHIDILQDFHPNFIKRLKEIAETHEFILMEDRKFADIGNTVQLQYSQGLYQISSWASLITVHSLFGRSILDSIIESNDDIGVFLIAEVSSSNNLIDEKYTTETIKLGLSYESSIAGVVCQNPLFRDFPGFLQLTPGVQLDSTKDNLGQQYNSPEKVIENGADIAVVGRGITKSADIAGSAEQYRRVLWDACKRRISEC
ncbi:hypothetical protein WA026_002649 [Henosepilachna vigintioctopunctata]|uniref:Uridine 5'-monophosphate synthase n=1 Tax=Henosepilachna vigintioctopunctata TaxID=420089 RepID=A0AAW1U1B3_9CUCU